MRAVCTCVYAHIQVSVSGVDSYTKLDSGVYIYDVEEGSGAPPKENDQVKTFETRAHFMHCKHDQRRRMNRGESSSEGSS